MEMQKKKVFQLLVDNTTGVLSRVAGLFSRRGYNIESISAGVTADPRITRITRSRNRWPSWSMSVTSTS